VLSPDSSSAFDRLFWTVSADVWFAQLRTTQDGLSAADSSQRLTEYGRNSVTGAGRRRILSRIGHRLVDPLVAILMVAGIVSGLTGDIASCVIIFVILTVSIGAREMSPPSPTR
jgi:P-type Mg2+ transporter